MRGQVITLRWPKNNPPWLYTIHLMPQILDYSLPTLFNLKWSSSSKSLKSVKKNDYFLILPLMLNNADTVNVNKDSTIFHNIKLNIVLFSFYKCRFWGLTVTHICTILMILRLINYLREQSQIIYVHHHIESSQCCSDKEIKVRRCCVFLCGKLIFKLRKAHAKVRAINHLTLRQMSYKYGLKTEKKNKRQW